MQKLHIVFFDPCSARKLCLLIFVFVSDRCSDPFWIIRNQRVSVCACLQKLCVCRISIYICMTSAHSPNPHQTEQSKNALMHTKVVQHTIIPLWLLCVFKLSTHVKYTLKHSAPFTIPIFYIMEYTHTHQREGKKKKHNASIFIITPLMLSRKYVKFCF